MKKILFAAITLVISFGTAFAQQETMTPEEKEKKLTELIQEELDALQDAKVSNRDLYTKASDKWAEKIYVAMRGILNDEQWSKYLKGGAAREKKARDKRNAKEQ